MLRASEFRVVGDLQCKFVMDDPDDFDEDPGEIAEDSGESDFETAMEAGRFAENREHVSNVVMDSQVGQNSASATRVYTDLVNAFWSGSKVKEFFLQFHICCSSEGCNRKFLAPKIGDFQQVWSLQLKCPAGHTYSFLTDDLEKNHGTPDITGRLYQSSLCTSMTHSSLESRTSCTETGPFFRFPVGQEEEDWLDRCSVGIVAGAETEWPCVDSQIPHCAYIMHGGNNQIPV
ncbi:hypothetical protein R1sor_007282 [Riccia sorocarpa]|uniref:Uncharacterized protein n=1 Tax=Riccia sorocarpa TaxID=122646 RepID=A0ABD3HRQ4_9MARC